MSFVASGLFKTLGLGRLHGNLLTKFTGLHSDPKFAKRLLLFRKQLFGRILVSLISFESFFFFSRLLVGFFGGILLVCRFPNVFLEPGNLGSKTRSLEKALQELYGKATA